MKCNCIYATARNTPAVRDGYEMGGYVKEWCGQHVIGATQFDGATYEHTRDSSRLAAQMKSVFELMKDGKERTLKEIADGTGSPESSVSARLRDLRKERFGGYTVNRFYIARGLFSYQLLVTEAAC